VDRNQRDQPLSAAGVAELSEDGPPGANVRKEILPGAGCRVLEDLEPAGARNATRALQDLKDVIAMDQILESSHLNASLLRKRPGHICLSLEPKGNMLEFQLYSLWL
jgi:hypothetical protein